MTELRFRRDNPGGDWLHHTRERAKKNMDHHHGITGSVTGYFNKNLHLPVEHIKHLPGARGEEKHRHDFSNPKHERLAKDIKDSGGFNSKEHPIMIGVNHEGHGWVQEGNHRLAHAIKHGHSHIHAEVKYFNGGEDHAKGHLHPETLMKHHKEDDIKEDAATNNAGAGHIQGIGVGPKGEPGVHPEKGKHRGRKLRNRKIVMSDLLRRWIHGKV